MEHTHCLLYKLIPIPTEMKIRHFMWINPEMSYLAVSQNKQQFASLTENDISKCKKTSRDKLICIQSQPAILANLKILA